MAIPFPESVKGQAFSRPGCRNFWILPSSNLSHAKFGTRLLQIVFSCFMLRVWLNHIVFLHS